MYVPTFLSPKILFFPVCLTPGNACDPLIEDALGLYNVISKEERNLAKIAEINNRDPPPSWRAAPTSLLDDSFSEVLIPNSIFEAEKPV